RNSSPPSCTLPVTSPRTVRRGPTSGTPSSRNEYSNPHGALAPSPAGDCPPGDRLRHARGGHAHHECAVVGRRVHPRQLRSPLRQRVPPPGGVALTPPGGHPDPCHARARDPALVHHGAGGIARAILPAPGHHPPAHDERRRPH